ncbi:MAG: hypothetical protein P8P74_17535 [Crocinitomicaceae bacterium]|nr:hypothetical protein [Crocinitomicaceae bacterium]
MKKIPYTIVFSSVMLLSCFASKIHAAESLITPSNQEFEQLDDSTEVYQEYLGEKLDPIRKFVAEVDLIFSGDWSLVMNKSLELDSQDVTATIYVWNNVLIKIRVVNNEATANGESYYYFKNNEIVYVSEQSMEELGDDGLLLFKNKSFFENGTLIRSINNQDCGSPFNQEYRDAEQKRIMSDLDLIRAAFED